MNAAIATPTKSFTGVPAETAPAARPPSEPRSFGSFQAETMAIAILVVFVGSAGVHYATQGGALDAIGLALYLSFWIGAGFGFLIGGVRWGLEQFELDQQH